MQLSGKDLVKLHAITKTALPNVLCSRLLLKLQLSAPPLEGLQVFCYHFIAHYVPHQSVFR